MNAYLIILMVTFLNQCQTDCEIELSIKNKETFINQLVLIRGKIKCLKTIPPYPNDIRPAHGRFITFERINDNKTSNWPINSLNEFKAVVRLLPNLNEFLMKYSYKKNLNFIEKSSLKISFYFKDNKNLRPINLGIFVAKDSPLTFELDRESKLIGEKNDLASAIKRVGTAALLWQAFTSDSLYSHNLGRKTFRFDLDAKNG